MSPQHSPQKECGHARSYDRCHRVWGAREQRSGGFSSGGFGFRDRNLHRQLHGGIRPCGARRTALISTRPLTPHPLVPVLLGAPQSKQASVPSTGMSPEYQSSGGDLTGTSAPARRLGRALFIPVVGPIVGPSRRNAYRQVCFKTAPSRASAPPGMCRARSASLWPRDPG